MIFSEPNIFVLLCNLAVREKERTHLKAVARNIDSCIKTSPVFIFLFNGKNVSVLRHQIIIKYTLFIS